VLEVAFDEKMASEGPDAFITPSLKLLFGDKMTTTTAYGILLRLAKLFEDEYPPTVNSPLDIAIKKARESRNPRSRKGGKDKGKK
jgi:hypothetical protein